MAKSDIKQEIILYQAEDGLTRLDVKFTGETLWLTQAQIVELYQSSKANISEHIKNILEEAELTEATVRNFRTVQKEGNRDVSRELTHYNLDMILIIQNKMHFAAHGHTAAELQFKRADAKEPFMGLTSWSGRRPRKDDVVVAKNYLKESELDALNKITVAALDFAEVQALNRTPMYMKDWVVKIDEFLKVGGRPLLKGAGSKSKEDADERALGEYEKYRTLADEELTPVEQAYLENLKKAQKALEVKSL